MMTNILQDFTICLALAVVICVHMTWGEKEGEKEEIENMTKDSNHSIEIVDNDPEFLVGVKGIEKPLCFHIDGEVNQVIRLLQDPATGIIVNARIFHDDLTNKTYLGAIMISQGSFRIIAKQRYVMVNEDKLEWDEVNILQILGHRVGVGEDMLAVTFRKRNITLVIRRHVATPTDEIDYEEVDNEESKNVHPISGRENASEENTGSTGEPRGGFSGVNEGYGRANILPVIGFEERDSIVNRVMSSKRRRGLILQNFLGINQDQTFVRNLIVEVDGHGRKKREATSESETTQGGVVNGENNVHRESRTEGEEFDNKKSQERQEEVIVQDQKWHFMVNKNQGSEAQTRLLVETDRFPGSLSDDVPKNHQRRRHVHSQRKRHESTSGRKQRDVDEDYTLEDTTLPEGDKRKEQTVFLGLYIADARDLSNKTHGLLGQFLFKNVSLEKITYRNGRMKARLLINGNPSRRTIAFVTLRRNLALNATRACWKIRQQGRDVIDGNYSNYLVSNIRYSNLKDLPPPL